MMRAITLRNPYAWAVIHGGKPVENRTRNIIGPYRGPAAIHAGLNHDWNIPEHDDALHAALNRAIDTMDKPCGCPDCLDTLPGMAYGAVIGVAEIIGVHHHEDLDILAQNRHIVDARPSRTEPCSPWAQRGMWHIELANPIPLPEPIPCKGNQNLWTLLGDVEKAINTQLRSLDYYREQVILPLILRAIPC